MLVRAYRAEMAAAWNAFNEAAANGHFLFDRRFMDYHADRFQDGSLVVEEDGAPIALLPLNLGGDQAWSHQGLTFGGLIHDGLGAARTMAALDACAGHLAGQGVKALIYKPLPWIYADRPAQEDLYWLFRRRAALIRRDVSAAIDNRSPGRVSSRRERGMRKAEKTGLTFQRSGDWPRFWRLLESVLAERHGVAPVHTLAEIEWLAGRFPGHISLRTAARGDEVLAGVVLFCTARVAHAQYIAVGEAGRETGALDGLFRRLIDEHARQQRFFDFGISNTDDGRVLNEGLARQKEEFGASAVACDVYRVAL